MKRLKLYLETSVWNFLLADDTPEFRDVTKKFFDEITTKKYGIFISDIVITEINRTKDKSKRESLLAKLNLYQAIVKLKTKVKVNALATLEGYKGIIISIPEEVIGYD
ncbi:MAG: hypothetical protein ABIL39_12185 [candidate division WOR-3 bacterium]